MKPTRLLSTICLLLGCMLLGPASVGLANSTRLQTGPAAQSWTETYYIQLTFGDMANSTAHMFDSNFNPLPTASWNSKSSAVTYAVGSPRLMTGASFAMMTRDGTGKLTDVSGMPCYTEMNHHLVLAASFTQYGGYVEFPVTAGSELTSLKMPAGYGYPMEGVELGPAEWHWANLTALAGLDEGGLGGSSDLGIYLKMELAFSDDPTLQWVLSAWAGELDLCIAENTSDMNYTTVPLLLHPKKQTRIVLALPHIHDHVKQAELRRKTPGPGMSLLHRYTPDNSLAYPVEHDDCAAFGQPTAWHAHGSGVGHLPVGGLQAHVFAPGSAGPVIAAGEQIVVEGTFNNPHSQPIDNMLIYIVYYEILP